MTTPYTQTLAPEEVHRRLPEIVSLAERGKIKVMITAPQRKEDLPEYQQFAHLAGKTTWISQAARDYDIPQPTISRWIEAGHIRTVGNRKNRKLINSQDMAYAAHVYKERKMSEEKMNGVWVFDQEGRPYQTKGD